MTEKETHNLNFQSGMLQSWNKFCFSGGYIGESLVLLCDVKRDEALRTHSGSGLTEMSAMLPGRQDTRGFWPGLWTMGNLARPGYLGSTEGMWPYSYDSCDWGALANQTSPDGTRPDASLNANGPYSSTYGGRLSYLPGMRTGACTCAGEDHPGPNNRVGRSAPEIDILEAQNTQGVGEASQSLQTAPYDADCECPDFFFSLMNFPAETFLCDFQTNGTNLSRNSLALPKQTRTLVPSTKKPFLASRTFPRPDTLAQQTHAT